MNILDVDAMVVIAAIDVLRKSEDYKLYHIGEKLEVDRVYKKFRDAFPQISDQQI